MDCSRMLLHVDDKPPNQNNYAEGNNNITFHCECPYCKRLFCLQCKVPWHWGLTCPAFQKSIKDSLTSDDVKLMDLAKSENWQRCKKCRFCIEKSEGCPYITCRCGYRFCYDCGLPTMIDKEVRNCKCVPVNREVRLASCERLG